MENKVIIQDIYANGNKIFYDYKIEGEESFKKIFYMGELFSVEYNENIEDVPKSIMIIPFISNILPIIWLNDAEVIFDEIDYVFYKSINKIKKAYKKMLPNLKFKGKLNYNRLIKNKNNSKTTATFFSGGVDSFSTLITRLDEKPNLITIWGADIDFENDTGWNVVKEFVQNVGTKYNLKNVLIKTAVRRFIDNSELEHQYHNILNDDWWHAMQHGIGIIGNIAPYAYKNKIGIIYMPSTHTKNERKIVCASRPEIDNNFKFASSKVIHEGFEKNRQDKIENICNYVKNSKQTIKLRVCYKSKEGNNCNVCEKCYRTMMGIVVENLNPVDFGFDFDEKKLEEIEKCLHKEKFLKESQKVLWRQIQRKFYYNEEVLKQNKKIGEIFNIKF